MSIRWTDHDSQRAGHLAAILTPEFRWPGPPHPVAGADASVAGSVTALDPGIELREGPTVRLMCGRHGYGGGRK